MQALIVCCFALASSASADDAFETEVPWVIGDMAAHPSIDRVYVVNETDGDLLAINSANNSVFRHYRSVYSLADARLFVSADGTRVYMYAPKSQRLFIFYNNLAPASPTGNDSVFLHVPIGGFVVAADGYVYGLNLVPEVTDSGDLRIVKIDLNFGTVQSDLDSLVFRGEPIFSPSSDGSGFFVYGRARNPAVINSSKIRAFQFATTSGPPIGVGEHFTHSSTDHFSADDASDQLYRGNFASNGLEVWNISSQTLELWPLDGALGCRGISQQPGSDSVWTIDARNFASTSNRLVEFDKLTKTVVRQIPLSLDPDDGTIRDGQLEATSGGKVFYSKVLYGSDSPNAVDGTSYFLGMTDSSSFDQSYTPTIETPYTAADVSASDEADVNEVYVSWTKSSRATSYLVYQRKTGTGNIAQIGTVLAPATSFTDTTAVTGQTYEYTVAASNAAGTSPHSLADEGSVLTLPPAPEFTTTSGHHLDEVAIDGAFGPGVKNVTGLRIYRSDTNDFSTATEIGTTSGAFYASQPDFADFTVVPGQLYYYWGRFENDAGLGPASTVRTGYSGDREPPDEAPANVWASDGSNSIVVSVNWSRVATGRSYELLRSTTDDLGTAVVIETTTDDVYYDGDVEGLTVYYYWVRAVNSTGAGPATASNSGYRLEQSGPPDTPSFIAASDGSEYDHVFVDWNYIPEAFGYTIYRHTSDDFSSATEIGATRNISLQDFSAVAGTTYYYWVTANHFEGSSSPSDSDSGFAAVLPAPSEAPASVTASAGELVNQVRVTWTSTAVQPTFEIYRATINNPASASLIGTTEQLTFDDLTAVPHQDYYYWVKATNSSGSSGWSVSVAGHAAIGIPDSVYATGRMFEDMVRITWNSVNGAERYRVFRSTGFNDPRFEIASVAAPVQRYEDSTAVAGNSYYYWVRAETSEGQLGDFSDYDIGSRADEPLAGKRFTRLSNLNFNEFDVDFDLQRNRAYVTTPQGLIEVFDLVAQKFISAEWNTERIPIGADITPDNRFLVVGQKKTLSDSTGRINVIDLESGVLHSHNYTLEEGEGGSFDVAVLPDNKALFTTDGSNADRGQLRKLDLNTGDISLIDTNGAESGFGRIGSHSFISVTPDRRIAAIHEDEAFYQSIFFYDTAQAILGTTSTDVVISRSGDISPDGSLIANMWWEEVEIRERQGGRIVHTIRQDSEGVLFDPVRPYFYVTGGSDDGYKKIRAYSTNDWTEQFVIDLQERTSAGGEKYEAGHLSMSPDGQWLAVNVNHGVEWIDMSGYQLLPRPPRPVTASDFTTHWGIDLSWPDAGDGTTHYNIYRNTTNDPSSAVQITSQRTQRWYRDSNIPPGTIYYYWVQSINSLGEGNLSLADSGERRIGRPGVNSHYGQHLDKVELTWSPEFSATSYSVLRSETDDSSTGVEIASGLTSLAFDDHNVLIGVDYYYWVVAYNNTGPSLPSATDTGTLRRLPPANLSLSATNSEVTISWDESEGGISYTVYRGDTPDPALATRVSFTNLNATTYSDSSAAVDQLFYWFVREAYSDLSEPIAGRRLYRAPFGTRFTQDRRDSVAFTWDARTDYGPRIEIRRSTTDDVATATTIVDQPLTSYLDTSAPPGVPVFYWLRSKSDTAASAWTISYPGLRRASTVDEFAADHGLTGEDAAPTADPDGDNFTTFEEWAQGGTDPGDSSSRPPLIAKFQSMSEGDYLTVSYLRFAVGTEDGPDYENESVNYTTRGTLDLNSGQWPNTPVPTAPPVDLELAPVGYEWGCVRLPVSTDDSALGFLKLLVTPP